MDDSSSSPEVVTGNVRDPTRIIDGPLGSPNKGMLSPAPPSACRFFHSWTGWATTFDHCDVQQTRWCRRCGLFQFKAVGGEHEWTSWELYDFEKPFAKNEDAPVYDQTVIVTHQRRRCRRCGYHDDIFVRLGPVRRHQDMETRD